MCLTQVHNAVTPVRLELAAHQSQVKHSTLPTVHGGVVKIHNGLLQFSVQNSLYEPCMTQILLTYLTISFQLRMASLLEPVYYSFLDIIRIVYVTNTINQYNKYV